MKSSSAEAPKGLKEAKNPTYKIGSQVVVKANHMKGMYGAKATIVGAYDTTAYAVTYTPTTGGPIVKNHKWVIQEEIKNAGTKTLKPGTEVTLEANHMEGMMDAKGTIDSAVHTTVYMIDYAKAAFHSGVGLVSLAIPDSIYSIIASQCPECLLLPLPSLKGSIPEHALDELDVSKFKAIAFGPGIGRNPNGARLLETLLSKCSNRR